MNMFVKSRCYKAKNQIIPVFFKAWKLVVSCITGILFSMVLQAHNQQVFEVNTTDSGSVELNRYWKYHEGDDSLWAIPAFDDSAWDTIAINAFPLNPDAIHWYRLRLAVDPALCEIPLSMIISHDGASEIFLDGLKLVSFGHVSSNKEEEVGYQPRNTPYVFQFSKGKNHLLSIRYSNHITKRKSNIYGPNIILNKANAGIASAYDNTFLTLIFIDITIGFFTGLTFLHLLLYFFYRADKNNLFYSLFTGTALILLCRYHYQFYHTNSEAFYLISYLSPIVYTLFFFFVFLLSSKLFHLKRKRFFYITSGLTLVCILLYFINPWLFNFFFISLMFNVCITTIFLIRYAFKSKTEGSYVLGVGLLIGVLFVMVMLILAMTHGFSLELKGVSAVIFFSFLLLAVLSVPVSMSVYLARNFAAKSKSLAEKLIQVEQLSEQAAIQAKEKEEILSSQNVKLEQLVNQRTAEVTIQKNELEKRKEELENKNKEITDSLHYARYLQEVILPPIAFVKSRVRDCFILYKPKDIVAGDFYFAEAVGDTFFIAAADCTGHGVPGAILSVLCYNALNQATREFNLKDPGLVLDKVNELVSSAFEKSSLNVNDGMDISLLACNTAEKNILWAGANNPIWAIFNNQMLELKGNKQPIGKYHNRIPFTSHHIPWQEETWFYLVTDGYADQFGGNEGKKFLRKNLMDLIRSIHKQSGAEQYLILDDTFASWKGENEQVDDVTILGIMI